MNFNKYVNEVLDISQANENAPFSDAMHMFTNNIKDAGNPNDLHHYSGADHIDYAALKVEWDKLTPEEKAEVERQTVAWYEANKEILWPAYKALRS